MGLDPNRLYPSVFEGNETTPADDEAFRIWNEEIGVPADHIFRFGKKDNFWEHGSGPCGPCSEVYYDRGEKYGCGEPGCTVGCECDRFMEVWNNVFSQFDNDGQGNYTELVQKNIDTGMGLERLAVVCQDVYSLFDVDTVMNITNHVTAITGAAYGQSYKTDVSLRVITDHIRSTTFMIGDGVLPSNEGRGYVLRRLLRRAARHGRLLGINGTFLHTVCDTVIQENISAYPELGEKQDYIKKVILNEEENFARTIDTGLNLLGNEIEALKTTGAKVLSGENAFKLYDTYGFPLDLTRDILEEQGFDVDEEGFNICMKQQKEQARNARGKSDNDAWKSNELVFDNVPATKFVGYEETIGQAMIQAIVAEGEISGEILAGQKGMLVTCCTPFYAESGGQVGDTGTIRMGENIFTVEDTKKNHDGIYMHIGTVTEGAFAVDNKVELAIDAERRRAIARNHSALHLLHAALRQVLGTHVEQAGSYVDELRGRLDFTHFSAMTAEELAKVEALVNGAMMNAIPVSVELMSIDDARKSGAMALFGEKYGDTVRVVSMGDFSKELCGGTHLDNTGMAGLFRIAFESSVAAGVRRIECVTGYNVIAMLDQKDQTIRNIAETIKSSVNDVEVRAQALTAEIKQAQRDVEALNAKLASSKLDAIINSAVTVGNVRVASAAFTDLSVDSVRTMGEMIKDKYADMVAVLAVVGADKLNFVCACGKQANVSGALAGNVVRKVAELCGGKGGGRPDVALAGGKDADKVPEALKELPTIVGGMLK